MPKQYLLLTLLLTFSSALSLAQNEQVSEEEAPETASVESDASADEEGTTESDENTEVEPDDASASSIAADSTPSGSSIISAKYLCELQGLTRRVEVDYESAESSIPCSVNYYKDTEAPGEVNTLWSATNIEGYCEEKAAGFIEKLKTWGWSCTDG